MGIEGIDILKPDEFTPAPKVREGKSVSRHIVQEERFKYVFGWDQPLQSFYLQVHDSEIIDPDSNPVHWLGCTPPTQMYEVEDLCRSAEIHGLHISHEMRVTLNAEKDDDV